MLRTSLFTLALCLTACTKPVSAPVPDLPLPISEAPIAAPAAVEVPKTEAAPAADIATPAAPAASEAAPVTSLESAPVVAAPVK